MKNVIRYASALVLIAASFSAVGEVAVDPGIAAMNAEDISVYVESVDGNQRWPWNGLVDIDFTFRCPGYPGAYAFVEMSAFYESAPGVTNDLPLSSLTLDGEILSFPWATTAGTYRVTWDAGKDAPSVNVKNAKYRVRVNMARYMVLSADKENKKVYKSYLDAPDYKEGTQEWKDEYKTTKMALRLIQPHTNVVGTKPEDWGYDANAERKLQRTVSITRPYYIGIFECTREQSYMLGLEEFRPSSYEQDDMRPRKRSYEELRGKFSEGVNWPRTGSKVAENSDIWRLRKCVGDENFDLPTDAEWELAARAGYSTQLNSGYDYQYDNSINRSTYIWPIAQCIGNTTNNPQVKAELQIVGLKVPNRWGLYDCHGNVYELVLDIAAFDTSSDPISDPLGKESDVDESHFCRGGSYDSSYNTLMIGAHRDKHVIASNKDYEWSGFRICWRFPTSAITD